MGSLAQTSGTPTVRRRRTQFSLRSLLLLVLLMSLASGWLAEGVARGRRQAAAVAHLQRFPGRIRYDYQDQGRAQEPPQPAWARQILGDDFFCDVEDVCLGGGKQFTDADLAHVRQFPALKRLSLAGARISNEGMENVAQLHELQVLNLSATPITDHGLAHLAGLNRLQRLWLRRTSITDAGATHLRQLRGLRTLDVKDSRITPRGVASLRQALPLCEITY